MLACLGLHPVLQECHETLVMLHPSNLPPQLAFVDDITSILHPTDVAFQQAGAIIGATLNLKKTTLLSTLDPSFPNTHPSLPKALAVLSPTSHLLHGTQLLGTPIGSPPFITSFLEDAANTFCQQVYCIMKGANSLQEAQFQLYHFCAQSTLPHLLSTDFLLACTARPADTPPSYPSFQLHLPIYSHLQATTSLFLAHLFHPLLLGSLTPSSASWQIAHLPTSIGGLGLMDFSIYAASAFFVPFS